MDHSTIAELRRVRLPRGSVALVTRQLAVMLGAGLGISRSLETLARSTRDPRQRALIEAIHLRLVQGYQLSYAMGQFPGVFPPLYLALIQVGEATGGLLLVLERLSLWMERDADLVRRVGAALIYPGLVLVSSLLLIATVFATVLPGFVRMLEETAEVPWYSRLLIDAVHVSMHPAAWVAVAAVVFAVAALVRERLLTPAGRLQLYWLAGRIPVFRELLTGAALARFCGSVSFMLEVGVDLIQSLRLGAAVSGNPVLRVEMEQVVKGIHEGESLGGLFRHLSDTPPLVWQLVAVGEETARLPDIFRRLGAHFEAEVGYRTQTLLGLLEPALIAFLAALVGFTAVSVMVPLYGALGSFR